MTALCLSTGMISVDILFLYRKILCDCESIDLPTIKSHILFFCFPPWGSLWCGKAPGLQLAWLLLGSDKVYLS